MLGAPVKALQNISIKTKLFIMILLPILGIIYFSCEKVLEKMDQAEQMGQTTELVAAAVKFSTLVHETQKERGTTAVFLGSKGERFSAELKAQRK